MERHSKNKLLILSRWFIPGFQAGGLIRVVENLIHNLSADFDIYLVTTNLDFNSTEPYNNITPDKWLQKTEYRVIYLSKEKANTKEIKKIILEINPSSIYLNGFFDALFNIYPLILNRLNKIKVKTLVIAPAGMLMPTAISNKPIKKNTFLSFFRIANLQRNVIFHVTSLQEKDSVISIIGPSSFIKNISAFPPFVSNKKTTISKNIGEVSIINISRIHSVKNLAYLLRLLKEIKINVSLSVAGPIEEVEYWASCQQLINELPKNVTVNYLGKIPYEKVTKTIQQHHLFCLPTTGEAYGYVIIEALAAGRPVLISDQTPWLNLKTKQAGWDLPLDQVDSFISIINEMAAMNQEEFDRYCSGALVYAKSTDKSSLIRAYGELFNRGIGNNLT